MIESDTIKLLRECDAGIKMGVASIDEVLNYVHDKTLGRYLADKYLNQYKAADEKMKDVAKRLIKVEEKLAVYIRS